MRHCIKTAKIRLYKPASLRHDGVDSNHFTNLRHRDKMTKDLAKDPSLHEDGGGGEGDGEETHEDVGNGQVGDEDVRHRLHVTVLPHHVHHQRVARKTDHEYHRIANDEYRLEREVVWGLKMCSTG